jgi:hypothetical protein
VKSVRTMIEETIEIILIENCYRLNIDHEEAFVVFTEAIKNQHGVLRIAADFFTESVECLYEFAPEAIDRVEESLEESTPETLLRDTERAILSLFLKMMQVLGEFQVAFELELTE